MQLRSFSGPTSLKRYAKAFALVVIFLKVTHYLDCLCKSLLIEASFNDLLNVTSTVSFFLLSSSSSSSFFLPLLFICSTPSFPGHRLKKKNQVITVCRFLSFKQGLLSSAIICQGCDLVYSGWDQIAAQEVPKDLLSWN